MDLWLLIIASLVGLILLYAAVFYLASLVHEGSPFRIWLSYLGPRIRSRLSLYLPARTTESNQRSLYPKDLKPPQPEPPRPAPAAPQSKAAKQSVRPARKPSALPTGLPAMAVPSSKPLSRKVAMQAAAARRRVWIKYLDEGREPVVDKLDIYKATIDGHLLVWLCLKRKRDMFARRRIVAWQVLDETFEYSDTLAQWARREAMLAIPKRLMRFLRQEG